MYGAIIGDLAGSIYEYLEYMDSVNGIKDAGRRKKILTDDSVFNEHSFYSDDTILTIAILESILDGKSYQSNLRKYGLKYKLAVPKDIPYFKYMFSPMFIRWCEEEKCGYSYGNGSAMRISPVGYLFDDETSIRNEVRKATIPSHNNIKAIKGAEAVALTIFMARKGLDSAFIKECIVHEFGYDLNYDFEWLMYNNTFNSSCEESVKQALFILFSSDDFEGAIRKAVAIGGDTDTVACITGSMAEALYGIPDDLIVQAKEFLPLEFVTNLNRGYSKVKK